MKFWELASICRNEPDLLMKVLRAYSDQKFTDWLEDMSNIALRQEREKLDTVVPKELCEAVLKSNDGKLYKSGTKVRSCRRDSTDDEISYLEVFRMFGGNFLEEVLEKGSAQSLTKN